MKFLTYKICLFLLFVLFSATKIFADGSINAFYKGTVEGTVSEIKESLKTELNQGGFKYLGDYNPAKNSMLTVIAFTSDELMATVMQTQDRGALAGIMKIGLIDNANGTIDVSFLNPTFVFCGFLRDDVDKNEELLNEISMQAIMTISGIGARLQPFGTGSMTEMELKNFRLMVHFPGFDEPVVLNTFTSFQEGLDLIKQNLRAHKGGTIQVFEYISNEKKVAVFGVGLHDMRLGESKIIPILGQDQITAFPYELILQDKQATILSGKYRFPLFWSNLTMREFQKIGRTNRDIEYMFENLTKATNQ